MPDVEPGSSRRIRLLESIASASLVRLPFVDAVLVESLFFHGRRLSLRARCRRERAAVVEALSLSSWAAAASQSGTLLGCRESARA